MTTAQTDADRRLRAALRNSRAGWPGEVGAVVYTYGSAAIDLLRSYWDDGILSVTALGEALHELGYVDDDSSHESRRALLVDVLADADPDLRYAAGQGLVYLADPAALPRLTSAMRAERNPIVRAQIEDAINAAKRSN